MSDDLAQAWKAWLDSAGDEEDAATNKALADAIAAVLTDGPYGDDCNWWVEFTDSKGNKRSEPSRCDPRCEFADTEDGAREFASRAMRKGDAVPPRVYRAAR